MNSPGVGTSPTPIQPLEARSPYSRIGPDRARRVPPSTDTATRLDGGRSRSPPAGSAATSRGQSTPRMGRAVYSSEASIRICRAAALAVHHEVEGTVCEGARAGEGLEEDPPHLPGTTHHGDLARRR
jgi:hypothetical protein